MEIVNHILRSIIRQIKLKKLLGINIDSNISDLYKNTPIQLKALNRLRAYIGIKEMEILMNSFIYSNFNYCSLLQLFSSCKSTAKYEQKSTNVV